ACSTSAAPPATPASSCPTASPTRSSPRSSWRSTTRSTSAKSTCSPSTSTKRSPACTWPRSAPSSPSSQRTRPTTSACRSTGRTRANITATKRLRTKDEIRLTTESTEDTESTEKDEIDFLFFPLRPLCSRWPPWFAPPRLLTGRWIAPGRIGWPAFVGPVRARTISQRHALYNVQKSLVIESFLPRALLRPVFGGGRSAATAAASSTHLLVEARTGGPGHG